MAKIENMIDLRSFCLEQAIKIKCEYKKVGCAITKDLISLACEYEKYILGGVEIPKFPINVDRVIYETMLKMIDENKEANAAIEKIKETLANSEKE